MSPSAKIGLSLATTAAVLSLALTTQVGDSWAAALRMAPSPQAPTEVTRSHGVTVAGTLDRSAILGDRDHRVRMELVLSSDQAPASSEVPTDLIVVLDRSGSMTGDKLLDAKAAAHQLVSLLGPEDRLGLISYAHGARVDVPLGPVDRASRAQLERTIEGLVAAGGTNMQSGLSAALNTWERVPGRAMRTLLISDGLPDAQGGLVGLARESAAAEIPLTTIGIGLDYDEALMTTLANVGTGSFYWTQRGDDLAGAFATELHQARETVASQVTVKLHAPGGATLVETAGFPIHDHGFDIGSLVAGQERRLWVTLELPRDHRGGESPGRFELAWTDQEGASRSAVVAVPAVSVARDHGDWVAAFDEDSWERAVLTEDYNVMQAALSRQVQAGDCDGALHVISDYRERFSAVNDGVGSARIAENLRGLDALEADVKRQFEGADQAARQNVWAKSANEAAYSGRRGR